MKKYNVLITETVVYKVAVDAENEQEAKEQFFAGEVDYNDGDITFSEVNEIFAEEAI